MKQPLHHLLHIIIIHCSISAMAEKINGAYRRPKGSVLSINTISCQHIPNTKWSCGCTGGIVTSILASSAPLPTKRSTVTAQAMLASSMLIKLITFEHCMEALWSRTICTLTLLRDFYSQTNTQPCCFTLWVYIPTHLPLSHPLSSHWTNPPRTLLGVTSQIFDTYMQ